MSPGAGARDPGRVWPGAHLNPYIYTEDRVGWALNLWGSADLLYAFYQGLIGVGIEPGQLGAAYFIPTVVVPLLLITHGLVFRLSLRRDGVAGWRDS